MMTKVTGKEMEELFGTGEIARTEYQYVDMEKMEIQFIKWSKKVMLTGSINIPQHVRKLFNVYDNEIIGVEVTLRMIVKEEEE